MPRRPRIQLDRVSLHVVQRGHNREACFLAEVDYQHYLHRLDEALAETECELHAYALIKNQRGQNQRKIKGVSDDFLKYLPLAQNRSSLTKLNPYGRYFFSSGFVAAFSGAFSGVFSAALSSPLNSSDIPGIPCVSGV